MHLQKVLSQHNVMLIDKEHLLVIKTLKFKFKDYITTLIPYLTYSNLLYVLKYKTLIIIMFSNIFYDNPRVLVFLFHE